MPSYALDIANGVQSVVAALTNVPDVVEVRDNDEVMPRDPDDIVVITIGDENEIGGVSGAGSGDDYGSVFKTYQIGISIYHRQLSSPALNLERNIALTLAAKQALNRPSLAGAPTVYGTHLVQNAAWENNEFKKGLQVSRFGLLFLSSESRAGG